MWLCARVARASGELYGRGGEVQPCWRPEQLFRMRRGASRQLVGDADSLRRQVAACGARAQAAPAAVVAAPGRSRHGWRRTASAPRLQCRYRRALRGERLRGRCEGLVSRGGRISRISGREAPDDFANLATVPLVCLGQRSHAGGRPASLLRSRLSSLWSGPLRCRPRWHASQSATSCT